MNGSRPVTAAYSPEYFAETARIEDRHFWYRARNNLIVRLVRRTVRALPKQHRVLEVGCGNGNVLRLLSQACPEGLTVGMDFFERGLQLARMRTSCPLVQGDARRPPFGRPFHLVGMFDVLEHIEDDMQMLRDVLALLEPGGTFLVTVPAGMELWSYFDEGSQHFRRYEAQELTRKLQDAGFEVSYVSPFMCAIYPLLRMTRRPPKGPGAAKEDPGLLMQRDFKIVPVINECLAAILTLEALWVSRGHRLPFGTSLLAVARRPALHR